MGAEPTESADGTRGNDHDPEHAPSAELIAKELAGELTTDTDDFTIDHPNDHIFTPAAIAEIYALLYAARAGPPGLWGRAMVRHLSDARALSPGTVYPVLHDLADAGLLTNVELTKVSYYALADAEGVDTQLERYERYLTDLVEAVSEARAALETDTDAETDSDS